LNVFKTFINAFLTEFMNQFGFQKHTDRPKEKRIKDKKRERNPLTSLTPLWYVKTRFLKHVFHVKQNLDLKEIKK